ncbi:MULTISPECIES: alpha/beta fold hydrolase [unclassified Vibrio]|uniref:Alpha/beta hydrolase n=1 Tax=Vibrio sp. HB236076 TaxID=3232307 RepID=A0AB39HCM0_9VIBR|nr:alpha/beta hydrolase [Vibrio sp. HB161653]MDP5253870.1 alpha/beta hydrolase [Vibrio sp. HB161653]
MFHSRTVFTESAQIALLECGDGNRAPFTMVFLHGWLDNAASFFPLVTELKDHLPLGHYVLLDLPGHGLSSDKPTGHYYSFHDYIDDIHQCLAQITSNKLVMVGHSLGGMIATCYSAAFPEHLLALIQIESFGPLPEAENKAVTRLRQGVIGRARRRAKKAQPVINKQQAISLRASSTGLSCELIAPIVERDLQPSSHGWQWRHDPRLKCDSLYRMNEHQASAFLSSVSCAHLVILGESGFSSLKQRRQNWPQIDTVHIGGGHHCHLNSTQACANKIITIVNKINP